MTDGACAIDLRSGRFESFESPRGGWPPPGISEQPLAAGLVVWPQLHQAALLWTDPPYGVSYEDGGDYPFMDVARELGRA